MGGSDPDTAPDGVRAADERSPLHEGGGADAMEIHKPKAVHGWRELANEIGVIVIGVLIALGAEQVVETLHWREKVTVAREAVDEELQSLLRQSYEATQLAQCTTPWIDATEAAIKRRDTAALQTLYNGGFPFQPRNWRSTAWQTIMSTQIADHLDKRYLTQQAFIFTSFEDLRLMVPSILDRRAELLSARLGVPDAAAQRTALTAAERLRSQLDTYAMIANSARGRYTDPWAPPERWRRLTQDELAQCRATVDKANRV